MFCDRHSQQRKRKNDLCQIKWQTDRRIFPQAKCVISFSPPLFILYVSPCSFVVYVHNGPPVAFSFAVVSLSIDCFHIATSCAVWSQRHAAGSEAYRVGLLRSFEVTLFLVLSLMRLNYSPADADLQPAVSTLKQSSAQTQPHYLPLTQLDPE